MEFCLEFLEARLADVVELDSLFLISDIVLILNTFGPETKTSLRITNIVLYYIGQLLIALSLKLN